MSRGKVRSGRRVCVGWGGGVGGANKCYPETAVLERILDVRLHEEDS